MTGHGMLRNPHNKAVYEYIQQNPGSSVLEMYPALEEMTEAEILYSIRKMNGYIIRKCGKTPTDQNKWVVI